MSYLNNIAAIIEAIYQQWAEIKERAGKEWIELEPQLLNKLGELIEAKDEKQAQFLTMRLLKIGSRTSAGVIFRKIIRTYSLGESMVEVSRLGDRFTTRGNKSLESTSDDEVVTLATLKSGIRETLARLQEETTTALDDPSSIGRYLNSGFFTVNDEYVEPEHPLSLDNAPYRLVVNIGEFWGPGTAVSPFPPLPDELYDEDNVLILDVIARTQDDGLQIGMPQQTLTLPKKGNSPPVIFEITVVRNGRYTIDVDVFYRGHLLQSRRTEFKVVQHAGEELPASAWPVQDGYITFTRTAHLTREALVPLDNSPRRLTILAERDASYQYIGIRVYDNSGDSLTPRPSALTDRSLGPLLDGLRKRLLETMEAYAGGIGAEEGTLTKYLVLLAGAGFTFYNLLPGLRNTHGPSGRGQWLQTALRPGDVIQIAPLSAQVSVPWELVYERPIHSYDERRSKLCRTFREHGPDPTDCPHHDDANVVCPHGFWGYRYIIEQLPCRVERNATSIRQELPLLIFNNRPLQLTALTYNTGELFARHWQNLRSLATEEQLQLHQVMHWDGADEFFTNRGTLANLVYFYTHGGKNDIGQPYLQISDGSRITINDLEAWNVNWRQEQPLVVLNACESADYSPDDYESLILFFSQRGAVGVIGTQCAVKEKLADAFILPFFAQFLRQMPAGEALFAARRQLLYDHLDPRGLAYSLFAAAEVKLAQPVIEPKV